MSVHQISIRYCQDISVWTIVLDQQTDIAIPIKNNALINTTHQIICTVAQPEIVRVSKQRSKDVYMLYIWSLKTHFNFLLSDKVYSTDVTQLSAETPKCSLSIITLLKERMSLDVYIR